MVLLDKSGPEPQVLLGRRNAALKFLPDKYVFPGGRLEPADRSMPTTGALSAACREKLGARRTKTHPEPEAFALAAIRETFEETGLLFGKPSATIKPVPPQWRAYADLGFVPDLAPLTFIARAVTPPRFPYRYDTCFFALDISTLAHRIEGCAGAGCEFVELLWLPLAAASQRDIPQITAMILLEVQARLAANGDAGLAVPFFYERGGRFIREEL